MWDSECNSSFARYEQWRSPWLGCRDYVLLNYWNDFGLSLHNASKQFTISVIGMYTPGKRQSKTLIPSTNADQKSLGTVFSIAICRKFLVCLFLCSLHRPVSMTSYQLERSTKSPIVFSVLWNVNLASALCDTTIPTMQRQISRCVQCICSGSPPFAYGMFYFKFESKWKIPYNKIKFRHDWKFVCLFDLILYVHSTIFQLCGTCLPGLNQY